MAENTESLNPMPAPTPSGKRNEFSADELFFSTTDRAGHIQQANDVFVRLSGYEREELISKPHNIVRHPKMPAGVFYLLWQASLNAKPFAGYIRNLAADGSHYDVFATVTPLPDGGFLSVRSLPMSKATRNDMWEAYQEALAIEQSAREDGKNARQAAIEGANFLEQSVKALGYESYEVFQRQALLREVMLREDALEGSLGLVITNTIDLMVRAAMSVHAEVSVLSFDQAALDDLARHIEFMLTRISQDIDLQAAAELGLWDAKDQSLREKITQLKGLLKALGALSKDTQFHISLARLHAAMVTRYADERFEIQAEDLRQEANLAIKSLASSLDAEIMVLSEHMHTLHGAIVEARALINEVVLEMRERRVMVDRFLDEAFEAGTDLSDKAQRMEPAFSDAIIDADIALSELGNLNLALEEFDDSYDFEPLDAVRLQLKQAVEAI